MYSRRNLNFTPAISSQAVCSRCLAGDVEAAGAGGELGDVHQGDDTMDGIFDGLRVLDFTNVLSGPSTARLLAELGAEVIKVELPPAGDMSRGLPAVRNGRSGYFVQQNRGSARSA